MGGLVEQIQEAAINEKASVSNLLRKVKLVAAKLELDGAISWVEHESNGYPVPKDVPEYRILKGRLFWHTRYHGNVEIMGDPNLLVKVSTVHLCESISSLENLISDVGSGSLVMKLDEHITHMLNSNMNGPPHPIYVHLATSSLVAIIDRVRNIALDWAVELERKGITGDGIEFSLEEKERAVVAGSKIEIGNMFAPVTQTEISGNGNSVPISVQSSVLADVSELNGLRSAVSSGVEDVGDKDVILRLIDQLEAQRGSPEAKFPFSGLMEYAANYVTVFGPYLPALAKFALGAPG